MVVEKTKTKKGNLEKTKITIPANEKDGEIMKNTTLQDDEHTLKLYKVMDDYAISIEIRQWIQ